ncbi:MAG: hypothetical protein JSR60_13305 [Proteobacteria bacterium]|nr:hypothetical protein [Pseudomonadota bacterium]
MAGGEIYVEFLVQGSYVRVTAIDPTTGCEAVIMGPAGASRAALSDAAIRKLKYIVEKRAKG